MSDSPFLDFAEHHDLDYAADVAPEANGKFPLPHGENTDLVGGKLPGGIEGLVGRLRRGDEGDANATEYTLVATRVPESAGFARFITCFEQGFQGILSRAIGPAGLGWIRDYSFESIQFNRRYRVTMLRSGKEIRLRELFDPIFLDWMADTAPDGLYWDLISGVVTVTLAGEDVTGPTDVENACKLAAHVAERIRSEALEKEGLGDDPETDAAWAAAMKTQMEQIQAAVPSPVTDVASAEKELESVVNRGKGFLRRLFGPKARTEATMLALTALMRSYADRNGLDYRQPASLVELMPFLDHFPMGVMRQASVSGALPEGKVKGGLVAFFDAASASDLGFRPALELDEADRGFVHVLPREGKSGAAPSAIGGFSVRLGNGSRRETKPTAAARERSQRLAASLDDRFDVVVDPGAIDMPVGDATQTWLASDRSRALVLEGGRLTLVGEPTPVRDWSFDTLDGFSRDAAPAARELNH